MEVGSQGLRVKVGGQAGGQGHGVKGGGGVKVWLSRSRSAVKVVGSRSGFKVGVMIGGHKVGVKVGGQCLGSRSRWGLGSDGR